MKLIDFLLDQNESIMRRLHPGSNPLGGLVDSLGLPIKADYLTMIESTASQNRANLRSLVDERDDARIYSLRGFSGELGDYDFVGEMAARVLFGYDSPVMPGDWDFPFMISAAGKKIASNPNAYLITDFEKPQTYKFSECDFPTRSFFVSYFRIPQEDHERLAFDPNSPVLENMPRLKRAYVELKAETAA